MSNEEKKNRMLDQLALVMYENHMPNAFKRNMELQNIAKQCARDIVENSFSSLIIKIENLENELEETKKFVKQPLEL